MELARRLAATGVERPDVMSEVDGIMVNLAWPERRLAILDSDAPSEDAKDLRDAGWRVVRPSEGAPEKLAEDVRDALDDEQKG